MPTVIVSSKGQIVIPKRIREDAGIEQGSILDVELEEGKVILRPAGGRRTSPPADWRRMEGRYRGLPLLDDLRKEHVREIEHDRLS